MTRKKVLTPKVSILLPPGLSQNTCFAKAAFSEFAFFNGFAWFFYPNIQVEAVC